MIETDKDKNKKTNLRIPSSINHFSAEKILFDLELFDAYKI